MPRMRKRDRGCFVGTSGAFNVGADGRIAARSFKWVKTELERLIVVTGTVQDRFLAGLSFFNGQVHSEALVAVTNVFGKGGSPTS